MESDWNRLNSDSRKDSRRDDVSPCFYWLRGRDLNPRWHGDHCALDAIPSLWDALFIQLLIEPINFDDFVALYLERYGVNPSPPSNRLSPSRVPIQIAPLAPWAIV